MGKTALLISGGAFKGAFDLPILSEIDVNDFDYVCGVSVGAVNGAMFACGKLDELRNIWLSIDDNSPVFGIKGFMSPVMWRNKGLYSLKPLQKNLQKHVSAKFLSTAFQAGVTSRNDGDYHQLAFDASSATAALQETILASCAQAGVHEPWTISIDGEPHLCSDGGHLHVLPWIPFDVTSVVAIFHRPPGIQSFETSQVDGLFEAFEWAISVQMSSQTLADYERIKYWAKHPQNKVTVFAPEQSLGRPFDARKQTIRARIEAGKKAYLNPIHL